ncbi:hypothetical protein MRX96_037340 [Rhipicephalus microplus]
MFVNTFATTYRRTEEEEREYKRRRAEAARRRRQNLSEEQKAAERERNAAAARQRRLHQTEEQRAAERERHRARRANPQVRAAERERDAEARRRRRANPHLRAAERARRRERRLAEGVRPSSRRQRRAKARRDRRQTSERRRASPSPTPSTAVWSRGASSEDDFKLLLDDLGQLCSACDRLCFRHDVSEVSPRHVQTLAREFPEEEHVEDFALCQACRDSLEAGSVALVARRCGYVYPPMPEWLTIISSDEEEQPVSCDVHGPMPVLTARSTQTDAVMPLSKRVDIAIGSSWIDDRGVSRSTQTQTSSFIAAKVHSWTATEMDGLPKRRSLLRKRTR